MSAEAKRKSKPKVAAEIDMTDLLDPQLKQQLSEFVFCQCLLNSRAITDWNVCICLYIRSGMLDIILPSKKEKKPKQTETQVKKLTKAEEKKLQRIKVWFTFGQSIQFITILLNIFIFALSGCRRRRRKKLDAHLCWNHFSASSFAQI